MEGDCIVKAIRSEELRKQAKKYEKIMGIINDCHTEINDAENKIQTIQDNFSAIKNISSTE